MIANFDPTMLGQAALQYGNGNRQQKDSSLSTQEMRAWTQALDQAKSVPSDSRPAQHPNAQGERPAHGQDARHQANPSACASGAKTAHNLPAMQSRQALVSTANPTFPVNATAPKSIAGQLQEIQPSVLRYGQNNGLSDQIYRALLAHTAGSTTLAGSVGDSAQQAWQTQQTPDDTTETENPNSIKLLRSKDGLVLAIRDASLNANDAILIAHRAMQRLPNDAEQLSHILLNGQSVWQRSQHRPSAPTARQFTC